MNLPKQVEGVRRAGFSGVQVGRGVATAQLPIYGNYCGPGHGDPTGCKEAIDEVDAVCCRHDVCYDQLGSHDCRCDLQLLAEIPTAISKEAAKGNAAAVTAGLAIEAAFTFKPCKCGEFCIPIPGFPDPCIPIIIPPFLCPRSPAVIV